MRIDGAIPFHVARAYGLPSSTPARPAAPTSPVQPTTAAEAPARANELVGGRVERSVLDTAEPPMSAASANAFPMYTRAADKIEAVVGVQVGRAIDIKG